MIARVFPTRTKMTPRDRLAFYGPPPLFLPDITAVHVSVAFTYDRDRAEWLAGQWEHIAPTQIGGPGWPENKPGDTFTPGMYLRNGIVITSRGCPNRCWFCNVWKRDPAARELPIRNGWIVQDDNLLACSEAHIRSVFDMLARQPHRAEFKGGLEAKLLKPWHVEALAWLRPAQMFIAYDTPDDYDPVVNASRMLHDAGFNHNTMRCFVLVGGPDDTHEKADARMHQILALGFFPYSMLYCDEDGKSATGWSRFMRHWTRPAIIAGRTNIRQQSGKA